MKKITLVLHNIRSTYNVGSIIRTAEGFGVNEIYATGYTPYNISDTKLHVPPHVLIKMKQAIKKTALGADDTLGIKHFSDIDRLISRYTRENYDIIGLEQTNKSIKINEYKSEKNLLLILGEEVKGIPEEVAARCNTFLEIPMLGQKESFNVATATGIALYELRRADLFTEQ